ncbi:AN1-type zinc finger protein 1-like [Xenia sp. Carnegie-2017]|uniref:AN1-type zinc finger protein 1-like n=1 Tax=Xenia sp. Carnegie-2017 TaxID=2897299 RepID=UPI001F04903F|nr:AN1-type zinc finger protein 1-like [Xenia sp. Carnegie-2017]
MAEINIGKQCSFSTCQRLDFLPFTCGNCLAIFCLEHRSTTAHNCTAKPRETTKINHSTPKDGIKCFLESCQIREILPVKCEKCLQEFCLRHRHPQDHFCSKLGEENSSNEKQNSERATVSKKEKKGRGGARSRSREAKVALMKMKLHAVGDSSTPRDERIYFSILLPEGSLTRTKAMFFSKRWSVGKTIDEIAKTCKLKNENNKQPSKKLRLFETCSRQLTIDSSLEEEISRNSETLFSGSELIIQYVEDK